MANHTINHHTLDIHNDIVSKGVDGNVGVHYTDSNNADINNSYHQLHLENKNHDNIIVSLIVNNDDNSNF